MGSLDRHKSAVNGISIGASVFAKLSDVRKTRPDTQTTERATRVAIGRIYAMHAMRFNNARYFERRTSGPTGYPTPKFFFSRRNARRHLHIDVLRRAVLNVFLQQRADYMHISIFSLLDRSLPVSQNPWHRTLLISPRKV